MPVITQIDANISYDFVSSIILCSPDFLFLKHLKWVSRNLRPGFHAQKVQEHVSNMKIKYKNGERLFVTR